MACLTDCAAPCEVCRKGLVLGGGGGQMQCLLGCTYIIVGDVEFFNHLDGISRALAGDCRK